jgi:ABC-type bacteriocin/lantibiotic exporter with double-glycine peptidase domain
MKKNMGTLDKVFRILVAAVIVGLFFAHVLLGIVAIVLLVLAGIFVVTSFIGFCPLYLPFGISTKKNNKEIQHKDKI